MQQEFTQQDARYYVNEALGDYVEEFDVDAIIDDLREITGGSFDFQYIDHDDFNEVIQRHEVNQ